MFQIKYNDAFLDISPGQRIEFERENPMFLNEELFKEYSTPVTIKYSEANVALLGDIFFVHSPKHKLKIDVEIWQFNSFYSLARLVIDSNSLNRDHGGKSDISGYLLSGLSIIFSKFKDKKLNSLLLGGTRTIPFTTNYPSDSTNGYLQQFYKTRNNTDDYMVAPIRNEDWNSGNDVFFEHTSFRDSTITIYNGVKNLLVSGNTSDQISFNLSVCLQPRLKYVMQQLFLEAGFILDISEMNSTDWEYIFLDSNLEFPLAALAHNGGPDIFANYPASISFRLAQFISPEVTCKTFLLQICKKYGWTILMVSDYQFKLFPLKKAKNGRIKDFTPYASRSVKQDFSADGRLVSFKNNFPSSDTYNTEESNGVAKYTIETPVASKSALPTPTSIYDNSLVFVYNENLYYKIDLDATNNRIWVPGQDNIYNYEPRDSNESIDSDVTTMPVYLTQFKIKEYNRAYGVNASELYSIDTVNGYFPVCKQNKNLDWGLRTLLYLDNLYLTDNVGAATTKQYPLLSCVCNLPNGTIRRKWSNVYSHIITGVDYGIISYWFKEWLALISLTGEDEQYLYLPYHELKELQWSDVINIHNIPYLIKSYIEPLPYKGYIAAKLQRITLDSNDATPIEAQTTFVKFVWIDEFSSPDEYVSGTLHISTIRKARPMLKFFSDALATKPVALRNQPIYLRIKTTNAAGENIAGYPTIDYKLVVNGPSFNIASGFLIAENSGSSTINPTSDLFYKKSYHLMSTTTGIIYYYHIEVKEFTDYTIIP